MVGIAGPPAPGVFAPFSDLTDLIIGPHNLFVRNGITLNDRSLLETYWVDDPTGFDTPARSVNATQNVQQHGALPETSWYGERTMTLTGWVQAGSYPQVMRMSKALLNSAVSLDEKPMLITTKDGGVFKQPDVTISCKVADITVSSKVEGSDITGIFKRSFTISLRASNPVFRGTVTKYAMFVPTTVNARGRTYNKTFPYQYNIPMDPDQNPVADGGNQVIVHNTGNWLAEPKVKFTGPMGYSTFVNQETGQSMFVKPLGIGQTVTVDMLNGDIVDENGDSAARKIETASDWMWLNGVYDEHDGDSTLVLYTDTFGAGSKVEIWWEDTSI